MNEYEHSMLCMVRLMGTGGFSQSNWWEDERIENKLILIISTRYEPDRFGGKYIMMLNWYSY